MRYAPPGLCLNDFDVLRTAHGYDVLHLQGPWTDRFDERRMETSFGHARSADLVGWQPLGPCFGVGHPDRFDANAIWTMQTFPAAGGTAMVYTGVLNQPWPEQSVGLAHTDRDDATGWARVSTEPIVTADPRWYRTGVDMAWRDPFVTVDEGRWFMAVCASDVTMPTQRSGCVGFAMSDDLLHWDVLPPLLTPGDVDELECPVLERTEHGWLLLGCHGATHQIEAWSASSLTGPWSRLGPIAPRGPYAPRLVDGPSGERLLLHTVQRRTGLHDEGQPCRGMLAQPKVLDTSDPVQPKLRWWAGSDAHFGTPTTQPTTDGLLRFAAADHGSSEVVLRGSTENPLLSLVIADGDVRLVQAGVMQQRTPLAAVGGGSIKVLLVGEFAELYVDDVLVASTSSYTPQRHPILRRTGERVPMAPLIHQFDGRDDVSAVPLRLPATPPPRVMPPPPAQGLPVPGHVARLSANGHAEHPRV